MPLYQMPGTPIQFNVTDEFAEAYNRVNLLITKTCLECGDVPIKVIDITVNYDDLLKHNEVSAVIEGVRGISGGYYNTFSGNYDEPRLVKV